MSSPSLKDAATEPVDDCDMFEPPYTCPTGKQREESRRMLKISLSKRRRIGNREARLCRSVLISNTIRRLQEEQVDCLGCYDCDNYLDLETEYLKCEESFDEVTSAYDCVEKIDDVVVEKDFDAKLAEKINKNCNVLDSLVKSESGSSRISSRKRSFDELDDSDIHEVLSQFYMPPALAGIDNDKDASSF